MSKSHSNKAHKHDHEPVDDHLAEEMAADDVASDLEQILEERNDLLDQLLRARADFQNFRKRTQQEKGLLQQFATEGLVSDLLPVLDNFERTIAALESGASLESLMEGVKAVDRQLRSVLESQRLVRVPSVGSLFDPEQHEAIESEETLEVPEGTITAELSGGYKMADKVIRPARVRVAKKP